MASRRITRHWNNAYAAFTERADAGFETNAYTVTRPPQFFHFTDADGLSEILKTRTLWASLASALNDRSEMEYARALIRELIDGRTITPHVLQLDQLATALDDQLWRVYVISFCARADTAPHWLHYGRSGSGAAIAFKTSEIERFPYRLYPVLYERERQVKWCKAIITTVDEALEASLTMIPGDSNRELLSNLALVLLANHISFASARMKSPSFAAEEEWRLIAYVPKGPVGSVSTDPSGETYFRTTASRIIPFKKLTLDPLPVVEIVLGYSSPLQFDLSGLRVLMDERLSNSEEVRVITSSVPVRP